MSLLLCCPSIMYSLNLMPFDLYFRLKKKKNKDKEMKVETERERAILYYEELLLLDVHIAEKTISGANI